MREAIDQYITRHGLPVHLKPSPTLSFERVGDVLMIDSDAFMSSSWGPSLHDLYAELCQISCCSRVARTARIHTNLKRESQVEIVFATQDQPVRSRQDPGWVDVKENQIRYSFDLTKVMFSSGNVTEKARMGNMPCTGETIVDIYAGIGYYVLPFLVHGHAKHVYALEWNPNSIDALRHNLCQNEVSDKCTVLAGDNRKTVFTLHNVADRVNLGLLPSSEDAWPGALHVLKDIGGIFHVHGNVPTDGYVTWRMYLLDTLTALMEKEGRFFEIECLHIERVKSYAPRVDHVVADLQLTPHLGL